jgi:3-hydroxyacyl-CoA dehydrogenase
VLSRVGYGFIGNRMLAGYSRQAHMLLLAGASPAQVDAAAEEFGMAMGPLAMSDLAGLDVGYKARQVRAASGEVIDPTTHCVASALVELGRLGQKSGAGYYKYDSHTRVRQSDPEVDVLIRQYSVKLGIVRRDIGNGEIAARLFYSLINEGALILEEGIAQRPGDIDVVYVYGYAFPSAKGGPMYYADEIGLRNVYDSICRFRNEPGGEYWKPAPLLQKLANADSTFCEWSKSQE